MISIRSDKLSIHSIMKFQEALRLVKSDVPLLQDMTKYGFLPMEHQLGIRRKGITDVHERSYVAGFMLESTAEQFLPYVTLYTDKTAIYTPVVEEYHQFDIPVRVEYKDRKMKMTESVYNEIPEYVFDEYIKEAKLSFQEPLVYVTCWDPMWNRNASDPSGLFYQMLGILKQLRKN